MAQDGRLPKIAPDVTLLNQQFNEKVFLVDLVIDKSMIPFKGSLVFRHNLLNKTH